VLCETVLVLVIESRLERSYTRSSHDLALKETKQVSLSDHEDEHENEHENIASCTRNARPVSAKLIAWASRVYQRTLGDSPQSDLDSIAA
jgi:hypothetical protein